ncbi:MAG: Ig-like domain-containing protein [Treponema sp.]|nr:Ig-like domain-containing protein [Treponema sp.]MEE3434105.1 Ig-like domain-containing protein [Treponema sp.]
MKEFLKKTAFSLVVIASALLWTTCDVGLGEAVDNDAPSLTVTGPAKASVWADKVTITGTCSDDKGVKSVNILLKNTSTGASYPYSGIIDTSKKSASGAYTWERTVNELDPVTGKYPLPDGSYVADVTVTDINKRTSGVSSTAFDIDNTAPFFCVTSPSSLKIDGSKVYGRSVTISGEIADDHDIDHMSIRVFRTDASGSSVAPITLAKTTFEGFETAGGTTVYIAKYFDTPPNASSEDYPLYQNYLAMYGSATLGSDVYLYIVPTLEDTAGNVSDHCYVASALRKLIAQTCGVAETIDSLQTAQLQRIYNGTYTLGELNAAQKEKALEILKGNPPAGSTITAADYYCQYDESDPSKQNCFGATVNSDNNPTYDFNGYENPTASGWVGVNTGGTVTITLKAGRDGWGILPKTLVVNLYDSSSSGNKGDLAFSSATGAVLVRDATNKETKDIGTSVTSQSYYVTLPSLNAGKFYLLEAEGKDENDCDLAALSGNKYGFKVAVTITPPTLTAPNDMFYINGAGVKSSGDYKFRIDIKDESVEIQQNGVKVTGVIYADHVASKGYRDNYTAVKTETKTYTSQIVKNPDNSFYLDVPIKDFAFDIDNEKNYTIALIASGAYKDGDGNPLWSNDKVFMFWADNKKPEVNLASPKATETLISEDFSSYEKDDETLKTYITPTGTWSDIGGSGTRKLWYTSDDTGTPTISWPAAAGYYVPGTDYYEMQATGCYGLVDSDKFEPGVTPVSGFYTLSLNGTTGKTWTLVDGASQNASSTPWEQKIEIAEGINKIFRVVGVDSVGNLSAVAGRTNLNYDFEAPKVELTSEPASNGYYNKNDSMDESGVQHDFAITAKASDSYKIDASGVTVTATLNGSPVASGSSGYTVTTTQTDEKTVTVAIGLKSDGTSDGEWNFKITAKDSAGRDATALEWTRIVDTIAPAFDTFTTPANINGTKIAVGSGDDKTKWTKWDGVWFTSTGLVFNGNLTDSSSGVEKISYTLTPAGVTESVSNQKTLEAAPGTTPFTLTVTGFEQSVRSGALLTANALSIKAVDKAGNESAEELLAINIDQSQPAFAAAWYTYVASPAAADLAKAEGIIMSDGQKTMTVYGTVSCPLSGVAGLAWQIAGTDVTPASVKWTTAADLSSEVSYIDATWAALPGESYAVTGWKAVIPAASLGTPGDANLSISNKAQKTTKDRVFVIDSDVTAPTIVLNTPDTKIAKYDAVNAGTHDPTIPTTKPDGSPVPTEAKSVNGTLKISGSVSDDKELDEIGIYLSNDNTAAILPADTDITSENTGSKYNWTIPACKFSEYDAANKVYKFADGTIFTGTAKPVYIKIKAVDKAKNQTIAVFDYSVNPDSDRPIITITAPDDISAMTASNYVWKKNDSRIRGKVEDDDGFTNLKLEYSDDNGANWTLLNLTSGVFDFFGDGNDYDGKHDILFKVTDAEGTEFVSGDGTGDNKTWIRPKIKKDATDFYGKTDNDDTTVYIQIDTKKPQILSKSYKVIDAGEEKFDTNLGTVGGTRNKFWLYFYATDQSGINDSKIKFVLNGTEYSAAGGNLTIAAKAYPDDESKIKNSGGADVYDNNPALNGARLVTVGPIDVNESESSQWASGSYDGKITVYDKADMFREESFAVEVDNEKPKISRIAPSSSQTVSGNVNPYGTVSGAEKLWFKLSGSDASHDPYTASDVISQKSSLMWYLYFDGGVTAEAETHAKTLRRFIVDDLHVTTDDAIDDGSFKDIVSVYLWIKAQDAVGNFIEDKYLIKFDPQGSRPEVSFSYPLDDSETMGEDIKIYGGAKAKDVNHPTIKDVFAQIAVRDSSAGDITSFPTADDWNFLSGKGYAVVKMSDGSAWTGSGDPAEYAIRSTVNGSSWSIKLNENGKINPPTGTTYNAAIRVKAYDDANYSEEEVKKFKIDGDNPSLKLLYLEQFGADGSSATATAQRDYKEGVYVTGKWFLTFELTDGQGMGLVKIGKAATPLDAAKPANIVTYFENGKPNLGQNVVTGTPDSEGLYKTVKVKLPLETDTGCGSQAIYVYFEDKGGKGGAQVARSYIVSFDNEKPRLAAQDDSAYSISTTVQQSDGWYSFGSKVSEENASDGTKQSGFERLAFYFTRGKDADGKPLEIFDPMISKKADGNRSATTGLTFEDGLYWKDKTVTRDDTNLNMLTLGAKDDNIHTGGLVKLGGSIYRIKSVSDSGLSVEIEGQPKSSYTDALFAIANVVDNEVNEGTAGTRRTAEGYGYGYNSPSNDDGDLMIETLTQNGTSWIWNASIYSKNIADGAVQIHYVAYDKAGNYSCAGDSSESPVVDATVCNNRPRIARINLGTDMNGDNSVDFGDESIEKAKPYPEDGELLTWNQDYNYGGAVTEAILGSNTKAHLTAKGMTVIKPEILGGNGNIYYAYKISKKNGTEITSGANVTTPLIDATAKPLVETVEEDKTKSDTTARGGEMTIQVGDFNSLGIVDTAANAPHKFDFTFYDQTEGAPAYGDAGFGDRTDTATATIYMAVNLNDTEEPTITRENLFWKAKGATDSEGNPNNSVYWNGSTAAGHIDLSADLPSDKFNATAGATNAEMDTDDKVSGKIVLRGTVSDKKMLYRIYVNIQKGTTGVMDTDFAGAGMTKAAATEPGNGKGYIASTYNAATKTWSNVNKLADNGVQFTVTDNGIDEDGHSADWEFVWDTSYIANVADTDVKIDVYSSDQVLTSASGTALTGLNGTSKYALPTATEKNVSGNTDSTKKPDTLKVDVVPYITGLNTMLSGKGAELARTAKGHWPVYYKDSTAEEFTLSGFNLKRENLPSDKISMTTSGPRVQTVNSVNTLNNLHDDSKAYNLQPSDTNENLTDKVYVDVWQLNSNAATLGDQLISSPIMKINPNNGLIGFAFRYGDGDNTFAMPGKTTSYEEWHMGSDTQNSLSMAYDANGNSFATIADADSSNTYADFFTFHSSLWGSPGNGVLNNENKCAQLEMTGQKGKKGETSPTTLYTGETTKHQSPCIATAGSNVYIAYYDAFNKEIRFRSSLGETFKLKNDNKDRDGDTGNFVNLGKAKERIDNHTYAVSVANCQIVTEENTSGNPQGGSYVSIAAIPKSGTMTDDVVVMVWYDSKANAMWYGYNDTPSTKRVGTTQTVGDGWHMTKQILSGKANGYYCKVAVVGNSVHIAAQDSASGSVWYAYLASYAQDVATNICRVDTGSVGKNIDLDVALVVTSAPGAETTTYAPVPYISYYASSDKLPKFSRLAKAGDWGDGVDDDGKYTGKWETGFVPTTSSVPQDNVNIGVWKNAGVIANSTAKPAGSTNCYGNTTKNAVLGYKRVEGIRGYVETAQLTGTPDTDY